MTNENSTTQGKNIRWKPFVIRVAALGATGTAATFTYAAFKIAYYWPTLMAIAS